MQKNRELTPATTSSPAPTTVTVSLILNVPEYAARYGVKKRTVFSWVAKGIPHLKISPRLVRIPVEEADRWMHEQFSRRRRR